MKTGGVQYLTVDSLTEGVRDRGTKHILTALSGSVGQPLSGINETRSLSLDHER